MPVNHALWQAKLLAAHDAGLLEVKARHHGHVALQQQLQPFVIDEGRVLDAVVASPQRVLDALGGAAVAGDLELVVVRGGDDGVHLLEGHAQRVMVVLIGPCGIAGRIRLHPLDAVLHQRTHGLARVLHAVDAEHKPVHADLAEVGVPVHQPARAANLAAAGDQARAGDEILLEGLLQPHVAVEEATARAGGRVAAFER